MNRGVIAAAVFACAVPLMAEQAAPAPAPSKDAGKVVATINGEVLTKEQFDILWNRLGTQTKNSYQEAGGRAAYLENYIRKRLIVQEAMKVGFDQRPEVRGDMQASAESTLFDRFVRDVIAEEVVPEKMVREYYEKNPDEFKVAEKYKLRHIVLAPAEVGARRKTKEQARTMAVQVAEEIRAAVANATNDEAKRQVMLVRFQDAARRYSDDGAREMGGDLGWVQHGALDADFEKAAFALKPGEMSGVVETGFGYHLILLEDKQEAHTEPYEIAKRSIREFLLSQRAADVMSAVTKLTNDLRSQSKISLIPANLE